MELGRVGAWWSGDGLDAGSARELEDLGYGTLWSSGRFDPGLRPFFAETIAATRRMVVASGIASIWVSPPDEIAAAVAELADAFPGRFLLGIGVSHSARVPDYAHPYDKMVAYLDGLDGAGRPVPPDRRVLAALGPRMLALAAARSAGAHPYFVPVAHTREARVALGAGPLLAPEVAVVLERDPATARRIARSYTAHYLALPNYAGNLPRLGYRPDDLAGAGSDRLVDAVVAWGAPEKVADAVRAHHDAGADHVCVQVLTGGPGFPMEGYRALAGALGL